MGTSIYKPVTEIPPEILPKLMEKYAELYKTMPIIDESELPECTTVLVPTDTVKDLTFRKRKRR